MKQNYEHICISNWQLVEGNYAEQLKKVLATGVDYIIFREKDFDEHVYEGLLTLLFADEELKVYKDKFIIHTHIETAKRHGFDKIHLTFVDFKKYVGEKNENIYADGHFNIIGVSTHSVEEAIEAEKLGASYITASHIYKTDCKKDLEPRGLSYLKEVCVAVSIPVYALGGIHPSNELECIEAGAAGVCMMSEYMKM